MMKFEECVLEAAKALLLLGNTPPPDRSPPFMNQHLTVHPLLLMEAPETNAKNAISNVAPKWGFRSTRTSYTGKPKREKDEGQSSAAAAAAPCTHGSPDTPLDAVPDNDPSTSGSDGFLSPSDARPSKRIRVRDPSVPNARIKASALEGSPSVEAVVGSLQHITRLGRKTLFDLRAGERLLIQEEKESGMLLESMQIEREVSIEENKRLWSAFTNSERASSEAEPAKPKYLLPDLNEPASENLEPGWDDNWY